MRIYETFEGVIGIFVHICGDVLNFVYFFSLIVISFGFLYEFLDVQISAEDSIYGDGFIKFIIFALRTSFCQQDPPIMFEANSDEPFTFSVKGEDALICFIWLVNQVFMVIALLNFSIAIVGHSY